MLQHLKATDWTPKEPFYAIKTGGELHPCSYHSDAKKGKYEAFVYGTGWKKSKTATQVPLFTGGQTEFEAYLKQYGKYCLFYAITGKELNSGDCIVWAAQKEFNVVLSVGFDYVLKCCTDAANLNKKIDTVLQAKHGISIYGDHYQYIGTGDNAKLVSKPNLFDIRPIYCIMAYFLTAPHLDVLQDDSDLYKHFVSTEFPETDADFEKLPVCMRDRLVYLFNEDIAKDYEAMMQKYPMTIDR